MANAWPSARITGLQARSLGEHVKLLAYLYWLAEGQPDGRAHVHWQMALDEVTRLVAFRMWQTARCPDGRHDEHWARAVWEVRVAILADEIWGRTPTGERTRFSAWIAAERQLWRGG